MEAHQITVMDQVRSVEIGRRHQQDWALVMLNGRGNLTQRQQQLFAHLVLKTLGAAGAAEREMFGWRSSGDLDQDIQELSQVLFSQTV